MTMSFKAVPEPSDELLTRIAAFTPENPFYTKAYVDAMRAGGFAPGVLLVENEDDLLSACTTFSRRGWLNRTLEITSLPALPERDVFWTGLLEFCRKSKISVLEINSFGSSSAVIEHIRGETLRKSRCEFQLDLAGGDLWTGINRHHKRKIRKAKEVGLQLRRAADEKACYDHARLTGFSLDRRRSRGEAVGFGIRIQDAVAFTQNGAGEIYQAVLGDEVLSSILVLTSARGAYAQSSGNSSAGMQCSASHFLWYEIARYLQGRSMTVFNLGGADRAGFGLQDFKEGFGAKRIELEAAEFYLGGNVRKAVGTLVNRLRG